MDISKTNLAAFASELEYKIKQASAETESAFAVINKQSSGVYVFRVNSFRLEAVPLDDDVANFFSGDSYVVADIELRGGVMRAKVFFWIGGTTSIDEAGTAAYKAFELDNYLGRVAIQYREQCGFESAEFRSLFPSMRILKGGYDSGFRHVTEAPVVPRLFQVHLDRMIEVGCANVCDENSYLLLAGAGKYVQILQWSPDVKTRHAVMRSARYLDEAHDDGASITVCNDWNEFVKGITGAFGLSYPPHVRSCTTKNTEPPRDRLVHYKLTVSVSAALGAAAGAPVSTAPVATKIISVSEHVGGGGDCGSGGTSGDKRNSGGGEVTPLIASKSVPENVGDDECYVEFADGKCRIHGNGIWSLYEQV